MTEVYFDNGVCRLVFEFYAQFVCLHLSVTKWGPSVYRLMKVHWPKVKALLRARGFREIHAYYHATNRTMDIFARRFGFREVRRQGAFVIMVNNDA